MHELFNFRVGDKVVAEQRVVIYELTKYFASPCLAKKKSYFFQGILLPIWNSFDFENCAERTLTCSQY